MKIDHYEEQSGVDVHFDPHECELFMKLASDVEMMHRGSPTAAFCSARAESYFSLSVALGEKIRALAGVAAENS